MNKIKKGCYLTLTGAIVTSLCTPVVGAYSKDETVYSKLGKDGQVKQIIVSEHLINDEQTIDDQSSLNDITNVNGEETFSQDGQNITWQANGKDIYYQGTTDKELPISMQIEYYLDGQKVEPESILGKSGKVEMVIHYTNNQKQAVDGTEYYVPFFVTSGLTLKTEKNKSIEVTNGRVESNGSNDVVMAVAMPGLYEDFDQNENLKGLDEVKVTYETTEFEIPTLFSVATPGLMSNEDLDEFNQMDSLSDMMGTLASSYSQIKEGGKTLNSGLTEFSSNYDTFNSGVQELNSKSSALQDGAGQMVSGVGQINQYLTQLDTGLQTISSSSETLRQGAAQIFNTSLASANQQMATLLQTLNQVTGGQIPTELTTENYATVIDTITNNFSQQILGLLGQEKGQATLQQLTAAKAQLDSLNTFVAGVNQYTAGVDQVATNVTQIKDGSATLVTGANTLLNGVGTLLQGTGTLASSSTLLNDASKQLKEGSDSLVAGMEQFDQEGISQLESVVSEVNADVNKTKTLIRLANDYGTFDASKDGVETKTKFILISEGQKNK